MVIGKGELLFACIIYFCKRVKNVVLILRYRKRRTVTAGIGDLAQQDNSGLFMQNVSFNGLHFEPLRGMCVSELVT